MLWNLSTIELVVLLGGTLLGAFITMVVSFGGRRRGAIAPERGKEDDNSSLCYLFHGSDLIDVTGPAVALGVESEEEGGDDWAKLRGELEPRFGDLPETLDSVFETVSGLSHILPALAEDDSGKLVFARRGARVRVSLVDSAPSALDRKINFDLRNELDFLRSAIDSAPYPVWTLNHDGYVSWCNEAYSTLAAATTGGSAPGGKPVFAIDTAQDATGPFRIPLRLREDGVTHWFEVRTQPYRHGWVSYAQNIDAVVDAELAQRKFVQTLTKTFAQLSIGLAIFDRHQRLALFNPALLDLTAMPADFLSSRPDILSFYDYLRDKRIMPEPKNYSNWRDQMAELVAAARDGRYCETWNLPSGLTYRVSGKPHPDGAVAFLFEDVSAEISLTRRFRAELETSHAVLDRQDRALAVFSEVGVLTFTNDAFRSLWRCDPDSAFAETTIRDAIGMWQSDCSNGEKFDGLDGYVTTLGERAPRQGSVRHQSRGTLLWRAESLPGGSTLISFETQRQGSARRRKTSKVAEQD